jgi:predicted CXXCH cytochrome family protein
MQTTCRSCLFSLSIGIILCFAQPAWADESVRAVKAEYVGTETCASCHADVAAKHQRSPHARIGADGPGGMDISCESCHGPGSLHVEAGGGKGVGGLRNPTEDPSACYACHTDKKMEFALQYHHPVPEGRMSCTDCHAPHAADAVPRTARLQNEQCMTCHQQVKGPWVFEHLAMRDGCLSCHQPHGSITTRLLAERDFNLCLKCHFSGLQYQSIGHYAHRRALNPAGKEGANCTGCHRAVHGSNFSKELRTQ